MYAIVINIISILQIRGPRQRGVSNIPKVIKLESRNVSTFIMLSIHFIKFFNSFFPFETLMRVICEGFQEYSEQKWTEILNLLFILTIANIHFEL